MKCKLILFCVLTFAICHSQNKSIESQYDIIYPLFDQDKDMGVFDLDCKVLKYSPEIDYKIMIDVTDSILDPKKMNPALAQVGRVINLHIINGVPGDRLNVVVVFHGDSVNAIFTNAAYNEKYKTDNPNLEFLNALRDWGAELYVCSQNLGFLDLPKAVIYEEVDIAVSAITTFTHYDQKGYKYVDVNAN